MAHRGTSKRRAWAKSFFAALKKTGNVSEAVRAARVGRNTVYHAKRTDANFAAAWIDAEDESADELVAEARKRAKKGSDVLLMFLIKKHRPEYRETFKVGGDPTNPIRHRHEGNVQHDHAITPDALAAFHADLLAAGLVDLQANHEGNGFAHPPSAE